MPFHMELVPLDQGRARLVLVVSQASLLVDLEGGDDSCASVVFLLHSVRLFQDLSVISTLAKAEITSAITRGLIFP